MMEQDELVSLALARVRQDFNPSPGDKSRVRGALGLAAPSTLAPSAPVPSAPVPSAPALGESAQVPAAAEPSRWAALKASGLVGIGAGLLMLGSGVGVGFWWGESAAQQAAALLVLQAAARPEAMAPPEAAPIMMAPKDTAELEPAAQPAAPLEQAQKPARAERVRPRATAKRTAPPLAEELALLRRVERALRGQDAALAVALLRELDERFPDTRLGEERLAARRMADCQRSGADPLALAAARREAQRFAQEHPASVYTERVQAACQQH